MYCNVTRMTFSHYARHPKMKLVQPSLSDPAWRIADNYQMPLKWSRIMILEYINIYAGRRIFAVKKRYVNKLYLIGSFLLLRFGHKH